MTAQTTTPSLAASRRSEIGKQLKQLRSAGSIPAVMYGHKKETQPITINVREFRKLYAEVGGSTLVNLKVDDDKAVKVLIHEVQQTAIRNDVLHVDFYQVNLKEKLRTSVPLEFVGVSDAVESLDGTFIATKDEVEIECLPDNLIQRIEVDISVLKTFEDAIHVSDLIVPENILIIDEADEMVASVTEPISQEELDALEEKPEEVITTEFGTEEGKVTGQADEDGKESKEDKDSKPE